jgi:uncharacterized protein YoaH (UPF0181 family)
MYDRNLKAKRDYENTIDYAVQVAVDKEKEAAHEAVQKAVEKEKEAAHEAVQKAVEKEESIINQMFANGLSMDMVCKITGMIASDIEKIVQKK